MRGVGWEAHVTSRDPTLDAVGTRSCAIRRGMSKKRATTILTRPSGYPSPFFYRLAADTTLKSSGGRPRQIAASDIRHGRDTLRGHAPA